ncbi:MAG TPA: hypothetical protein VGI95_14130 [Caulobacteraceae bacterium]|jgi:hypothetical protein
MTVSHQETELERRAAANGQLKTPVEASQGVQTFHVRWMLVASLVLALIAIGVSYVWYISAQGARTAQASPAAVTSEERSGG